MTEQNDINLLSPESRALLEQRLLQTLAGKKRASAPAAKRESAPLSYSQQSLWFVEQLQPNSAAYNIPSALKLTGPLNVSALQKTLQKIVDRHDILRTRFVANDGKPTQFVRPSAQLDVPVEDVSALPAQQREAITRTLINQEVRRPFNLETDLMMRAKVIRLTAQEHVLLVNMHHIAADHWSFFLLYREIEEIYKAYAAGAEPQLAPLPTQYADFAAAQRERGEGTLEKQLSWWKEQLSGELPILELPASRPRPATPSGNGARVPVRLPAKLSESLRKLSQAEGVTVFTLMTAAFQTLLYRYSGQENIIVGAPIGGRTRHETERLIGYFVNTVALKTDFSGEPTFKQVVARAKDTVLGALNNQDVPVDMIAQALRLKRQGALHPLFQVMFQFQATALTPLRLADIRAETLPFETGTSKFDLIFTLGENEEGFTGDLEYNTDIFDLADVERVLGHFTTLLEGIVEKPDEKVSRLPLLTDRERHRLLTEWSGAKTEYPRNATIPELFEEQVQRVPDAVALQFGNETISYRELNRRADAIANRLRCCGVESDSLVGISAERSPELIIGLLAILKTGGAYVPLDMDYPAQRVAQLVADAKPKVVLTQRKFLEKVKSVGVQCALVCFEEQHETSNVEQTNAKNASPDSLAYVLYTSGSTGEPKGVAVPHRAVVRLVKNTNFASITEKETFLAFAPISFDASTLEIWGPLLNGAKLVIFPAHAASLEELGRVIKDTGVTTLWLTSGLFHQMVEHQIDSLKGVRQLLAGGDVLSVPHVLNALKRLPNTKLINGYGPTENTTFTACHAIPQDWDGNRPVPIGKPINNTTVYVLDREMQPVPQGVVGELYTGGDGLAREYLNAPQTTAAKFVRNPFGNGKLYRTGDLVRFLDDGTLEFVGRADHQVKIRGFRIELGEIETRLAQHPKVTAAVVLARNDMPGGKALVGYYVAEDTIRTDELQQFVAEKLPPFMVPNHFVRVPEMPLTTNGKIDRAKLPAPQAQAAEFIAPRNEAEERLAKIWCEVMGRERVGVTDNFFELGGHSLMATQIMSRVCKAFSVELPLRVIFEAPTVGGLAKQLGAGETRIEASPMTTAKAAPLSFSQQRLWFIQQLDTKSCVYNIPIGIRLRGALNVPVMQSALDAIVARHEALRTRFVAENGEPVQIVDAPRPLKLERLTSTEKDLQPLLLEIGNRPFDLAADLMIRAVLVQLAPEDNVLLLVMHHIASDEWSVNVLLKELDALYRSHINGTPAQLPPLTVQYPDFATWQKTYVQGKVLDEQLAYWKAQLGGKIEMTELATDFRRPAKQSFRGGYAHADLPAEACNAVVAMGRREGMTPYILMLAAFQTLLVKYTGQSEIVIGSPIAGRNRSETEDLIGFFVNTLVLRTNFAGDPTFREVLSRVREVALGAYANQDLPFERLVEILQPGRSSTQSALVRIMFSLQNSEWDAFRIGDLAAEMMELPSTTAKFDLTFVIRQTPSGFAAVIEYDADLYEKSTIDRLLRAYKTLLTAIAAQPQERISALPVMTDAERRQILVDWNATDRPYPANSGVHELFLEQVTRTPEATAVIFEDKKLTYRELDHRSNRLASYLQKRGVKRGTLVPICMERSLEMIVGILAILKAGGAYVPLEPAMPQERLRLILADIDTPVYVTRTKDSHAFAQLDLGPMLIEVERDAHKISQESTSPFSTKVSGDDVAYVMFTSGSTGKPKGVAVPHRGISRLVINADYVRFDETCRMGHVSNVAFDAATFEIWGALLNGGTLINVPKEIALSPQDFARELRNRQISTLFLTTALFNQMVAAIPDAFANLRELLVGGDLVEPKWFKTVLQYGRPKRLLHVYGPTEATTYSTWYNVTEVVEGKTIPIGRPIANTQLYILDRNMQPTPVGVAGELYIGGPGLARSYINSPELTAQKFVPHPFSSEPGARLYKTGDMARYLAEGYVEFLGRTDFQVKLRGFRIELGEIENVLCRHPLVREAAVVVRELTPGDKRLLGYYVSKDGAIATDELRRYMKQNLPDYMVPGQLLSLPAMPLNANGKIDRKALPLPFDLEKTNDVQVDAQSDLERDIQQCFQEVLGLKRVGVRENFFEIGGHSLLAVRLFAQIEKKVGKKLPLPMLFQAPTVEELAKVIRQNTFRSPSSCIVEIQPNGSKPPIFWLHNLGGGGGGGLFTYRALANLLGPDQPSYGICAPPQPFNRIELMAAHYIEAMRTVQPTGPYLVGGYCFGGIVAFEVARQLKEQGLEVGMVALLESALHRPPGEPRRLSGAFAWQLAGSLPILATELISKPGILFERIRRKAFALQRRLMRSKRTEETSATPSAKILDELVDMSAYPKDYRHFAQVHFDALVHYVPRSYAGKVTLFRVRQQPVFRWNPEVIWGMFAKGGVDVKIIPGTHEKILESPCVEVLARKLSKSLLQVQPQRLRAANAA
jgi:amino acid adenylation domain-containing protein